MQKPLVSIVIPIFNVENYISECLESLLRQTYGVDSLEIIAVNDCTLDGSMAIVQDFIAETKLKIQIINHDINKGLGASRNTGLSHATGEYLLFLDPDDFYNDVAIERLVMAMENNDVEMTLFPDIRFDDLGSHPSNPSINLFEEGNKIIKRYQMPRYACIAHALSACHRIFRKTFLDKEFDAFPVNCVFEDAVVMQEMLYKSKAIFIETSAEYWYRVSREGQITNDFYDKNNLFDYFSVLEGIDKLKRKHPDMKYALNWLLARMMSGYSRRVLVRQVDGMQQIDCDNFFARSKKIYKSLDHTNVYPNYMNLDAIFFIRLFNSVDNINDAIKLYSRYTSKVKVRNVLRKVVAKNKNYFINIFISHVKKTIRYIEINKNKVVKKTRVGRESRRIIKSKKHSIVSSNEPAVLIGGRIIESRDNDFFLFSYIRTNYPEFPAYYVTSRESIDFKKVEKFGNYVIYGSDEHKRIFDRAKVLACTHGRGWIEPWPNDLHDTMSKAYPNYLDKHYVWLQHGVINGFLGCQYASRRGGYSAFICGAKPEYEFIRTHYGYTDNQVKYTGLARYDSLHEYMKNNRAKSKNILFMPTWRAHIGNPTWLSHRSRNDCFFLESEYYSCISDFLNSEALYEILEEFEYKLLFYPHPEINQYMDYFFVSNPLIEKCAPDKVHLSQLIKEADMLITDNSSIQFDFAYMKKPVLYYQFDHATYGKNHCKQGYFRYDKDAFGMVCQNLKEVNRELKKLLHGGLVVDDVYRQRQKRFFPKHDNKNCERNFEVIRSLMEAVNNSV